MTKIIRTRAAASGSGRVRSGVSKPVSAEKALVRWMGEMRRFFPMQTRGLQNFRDFKVLVFRTRSDESFVPEARDIRYSLLLKTEELLRVQGWNEREIAELDAAAKRQAVFEHPLDSSFSDVSEIHVLDARLKAVFG